MVTISSAQVLSFKYYEWGLSRKWRGNEKSGKKGIEMRGKGIDRDPRTTNDKEGIRRNGKGREGRKGKGKVKKEHLQREGVKKRRN